MRPLPPLLAMLLLAGCATARAEPELLPGAGRDAEQVDRDKYECGLRAQHAAGVDAGSRNRAAVYGLVGGGLAGAALGAIGGAIVGLPGGGASVGAVVGAAVGAPVVGSVKPEMDARDYEVVYRGCLAERGWQLTTPGSPSAHP